MSILKSRKLPTVVLLSCGLAATATPASANEWSWNLVPYVWASAIGTDVLINGNEVIDEDIGFDSILDNTDFASQIHFEGTRGKAGFFLDVTYLNLGDSQTTAARPPLPGGTEIKVDMRTTLFEAGGFYRLSGDVTGWDVIGGVRVMNMDMTIDFTLPPPISGSTEASGSDTFTDGFIGLRWSTFFADKWMFTARGDIGAGDSDQALNASMYIGYMVGKEPRNLILFGYRYMSMEYTGTADGGQKVETDLSMSGPAVGFAFRF